MKPNTFTQNSLFLAAALGSLVLLNVLAVRWFTRIDVTRGGSYTLSKATRDTLGALEDQVTVTAYFTEALPAPYASNARSVRDLLEEFRAASKGKLAFEFIDPAAQETEADKAAKRETKQDIFGRRFREQTSVEKELASSGLQPVEIRVIEEDQQQTKRAYMGLVLRYGEKKEVIPVVQSTAGLEYDLTSLVRKLTRTKTPVIGVLQGHDEPSLQEHFTRLQALLSQTYEVRPVTLAPNQERFDASLDALFVLGPGKALEAREQKAIDQLLMEGKAVAFFLDTVHMDLRTFQPTPVQHGLTAMLATYGVTVGDALVADVSSGKLNVSERRGFMIVPSQLPYPFIPIVKRLESDSVISEGLGEVTFPFASEVKATAEAGREVKVLARSSAKSWVEASPANLDPRRDWRSETITPTGPYPLMVQVSGSFKSHFAAEAAAISSSPAAPLLAQSKADGRLIVVGTSALFDDQFLGNSNLALLMNVADWLLLDPALLALRSRAVALAPLKAELSDSTRNAVKFGNALGLPLLLAAFGLVRWRMREASRKTVTA
jgi:gliding-associated putative ABC transporter substrate-binding component GldG